MSKEEREESIKELVLERLDIMPQNLKLSIGGQGTFTKQELIENVKNGSEIGHQVVEMEMNFIRALASGRLIDTLNQK